MPNLNVGYQVLIHEDVNDKSPKIKLPDISKAITGVAVNHDRSDRITIYPDEIADIVTTARPLGWDNTTTLAFERPIAGQDLMRIRRTGGSAPNFRISRDIDGDPTTTVSITRVTPYVARISVVAGTPWTLAAVQINDILKFEKSTDAFTSPFSASNAGKAFIIQAKGSNYIDFIDNGLIAQDTNIVLGADYALAVRVFSQGPVKVSDMIDVSLPSANPSNRGRFEVVDVAPDYLEIVNPLGVDEAVNFSADGIIAYQYLIGFMLLRATGAIKIKFGAQTEWTRLTKLGDEGVLMGSINTHRIQAYNDSPEPVVISAQYATIL